jgi:hypothetical protein
MSEKADRPFFLLCDTHERRIVSKIAYQHSPDFIDRI